MRITSTAPKPRPAQTMLKAAHRKIYGQTLKQLNETPTASLTATCLSILNIVASTHWSYGATNGGALALFAPVLYGAVAWRQACALHMPRFIISNISKHKSMLSSELAGAPAPTANSPEEKAQADFCRYVVYNQIHQAFTKAKAHIWLAGALGKLLGATMATAYLFAICDSDNAWAQDILSPSSAIETLIFVSSQFFLFPRLFRAMQAEIYNAVCLPLETLEKKLINYCQNNALPTTCRDIDKTSYDTLNYILRKKWRNV